MVDQFWYLVKIECHGDNRGWIFWTEKNQTLVSYPVFIDVARIHFQLIFLKVPLVTSLKNNSRFQKNDHSDRCLNQAIWLVESASKSKCFPFLKLSYVYSCALKNIIPHNFVHSEGTFCLDFRINWIYITWHGHMVRHMTLLQCHVLWIHVHST